MFIKGTTYFEIQESEFDNRVSYDSQKQKAIISLSNIF